ncbi:hypothetical protein QBC38DRAFT_524682 [Podospora fimiseda]|uniref:Uncharacterized protein n=1 Tax=Podospora fimiseda TaxID=252190 RepID=A0AAN6YMP1_9PEZI|nr:hypothetical protein QBC38DRAFT_524682 [Podospora fimiseda]
MAEVARLSGLLAENGRREVDEAGVWVEDEVQVEVNEEEEEESENSIVFITDDMNLPQNMKMGQASLPPGVHRGYWSKVFKRAHSLETRGRSAEAKASAKEGNTVLKRALIVIIKDIAESVVPGGGTAVSNKRKCLLETTQSLSPESEFVQWLNEKYGIKVWNSKWGTAPPDVMFWACLMKTAVWDAGAVPMVSRLSRSSFKLIGIMNRLD